MTEGGSREGRQFGVKDVAGCCADMHGKHLLLGGVLRAWSRHVNLTPVAHPQQARGVAGHAILGVPLSVLP